MMVKNERIIALDALKGATIFLVVLLHSRMGADYTYLDNLDALKSVETWLRNVRMPTFFFVSGVLVSGLLTKTWGGLLEKRLLIYLWLILVWSPCYYFLEICGLHLLPGGPSPALSFFELYITPYAMLWFIYALFFVTVFAKAICGFNKIIQVILTSLLIYGIHFLRDADLVPRQYLHLTNFLELRGVLFFQLGVWLSPWFKRQLVLFEREKTTLFLAFTASIAVATLLYILDEKGDHIQRVLLTASFIIIFVSICEVSILARVFSKIGSRSLKVFVLHQVFIGALIQLLAPKNVVFINEHITVLMICLVSIVGSIGVARALELSGAGWFFKKPKGFSLSLLRWRRREV
jgi:uncharacterized membrane protein YcfT